MTRTSIGGMGTLKKREDGVNERVPFYRDDAFWRGLSSIFDSWKTFEPLYYRRDPRQADYEALRGDWEAVGRDMHKALGYFESEYAEELKRAEQQRLFDPDAGR